MPQAPAPAPAPSTMPPSPMPWRPPVAQGPSASRSGSPSRLISASPKCKWLMTAAMPPRPPRPVTLPNSPAQQSSRRLQRPAPNECKCGPLRGTMIDSTPRTVWEWAAAQTPGPNSHARRDTVLRPAVAAVPARFLPACLGPVKASKHPVGCPWVPLRYGHIPR